MSATVESLQAALDERPDDWETRRVLADALDEEAGGECPLGHAQRWMADRQSCPNLDGTWDWWCFQAACKLDALKDLHGHNHIDEETFRRLAGAAKASGWDGNCAYKEYPTRRAAEEDLAKALWQFRPAD
jgi:hypothetical protein